MNMTPENFVGARIRILRVTVDTDTEFRTRRQSPLSCACCGGAIEWEIDEDRIEGLGRLYTTSVVTVMTVDRDGDPEPYAERVACCAYCAEGFEMVLGPRALRAWAAAWFARPVVVAEERRAA